MPLQAAEQISLRKSLPRISSTLCARSCCPVSYVFSYAVVCMCMSSAGQSVSQECERCLNIGCAHTTLALLRVCLLISVVQGLILWCKAFGDEQSASSTSGMHRGVHGHNKTYICITTPEYIINTILQPTVQDSGSLCLS